MNSADKRAWLTWLAPPRPNYNVPTEIEMILRDGDVGEAIGGHTNYEQTEFRGAPAISFNGVVILAERYLLPGTDTAKVANSGVSFDSWPDAGERKLPYLWYVMPKGLLLAYFRWHDRSFGSNLIED